MTLSHHQRILLSTQPALLSVLCYPSSDTTTNRPYLPSLYHPQATRPTPESSISARDALLLEWLRRDPGLEPQRPFVRREYRHPLESVSGFATKAQQPAWPPHRPYTPRRRSASRNHESILPTTD